MSAPSPSPSTSLAEEGEVKIAFNPWNAMSYESVREFRLLAITNSFDLKSPRSRFLESAS
jgi:hypothetical protein